MANWPSIAEPNGLTESIIKKVHRSDSELGYVQSRAKWTGSKKMFELSWNGMITADKTSLETFFSANQGDSFTWTHPITSTSYTCVFSEDSLGFDFVAPGYWAITIKLEEQQ